MGRYVNKLQPPHVPKGANPNSISPPPQPPRTLTPKYSPVTWGDVGKAIGLAALDIFNANPLTRLGPPSSNGLDRMRSTVSSWVRTQERKKKAVARDPDEEEEEEAAEEDADEEGGKADA
eukprot:3954356-Prymnesium_polylepis.1